MRQKSFTTGDFITDHKPTREKKLLSVLDKIIPRQAFSAVIKPYYLQPKGASHRYTGIERMPRTYFLPHGPHLCSCHRS